MLKNLVVSILICLFSGQIVEAKYRAFQLPKAETQEIYGKDYHKMVQKDQFQENELVFLPLNKNAFVYGVIKLINNEFYHIKSLQDNRYYRIKKGDAKYFLRGLKPLWQKIYQPYVDREAFDKSLSEILENSDVFENFYVESIIEDKATKIVVVGDLHGCRSSVAYFFKKWHKMGILDDNLKVAPGYYIVFLGDYADRVPEGVELYYMLFELKNANKEAVLLGHGNHEDADMARSYGFLNELMEKFELTDNADQTWDNMQSFFESMPVARLISMPKGNLLLPLLFAHAGVEQIPNLLEVIFSTHHRLGKKRITLGIEELDENNNFTWLDFFANYRGEYDLIKASTRGKDLESWSWQAFADYVKTQRNIDAQAPYRYVLMGMIRGHQHEVQTTGRLRIIINNNKSWDMLPNEKPYNIRLFDVITLVSVPEVFPDEKGYNADTFAILSFDEKKGWLYTPYIHWR